MAGKTVTKGMDRNTPSYSSSQSRANIPYIVDFIVQVFIGAGLFFGAKPLTVFWHRLQKEWRESEGK